MTTSVTTPTATPLDTLRFDAVGPPEVADVVARHLRLLGATPASLVAPGREQGAAGAELGGGGFAAVEAAVAWSDAPAAHGIGDEATVQAATGIMAVHGRRDGSPRGLAADFAATATGVLTVQGMLAALLAQARGGVGPTKVRTSADRTGLLAVSQYVAAAGADEGEAAELAPGGPPFTSADGVLFELETLDPGAWAAFWRALDAPADVVRSGWRPFQFRYATACAPFPAALHATTRAHGWEAVRRAASVSGAEVCALRTLAERAAEDDGAAPWSLGLLHPGGAGRPPAGTAPAATAPAGALPTRERPLAGLTVLEAGRRIQAPLAAHLLGLLGADVVRIEPPGGDPLRGMPPACSGISARWLALNRGKSAVEIDIKAADDRRRLREMAAEADVFLHNWAPGKAAELGLDAADFAAVNPALVHAYTSGWAGRLTDAPMGTDFMVQARTGVGEAVRPHGEPGAPSLMTLLDVLGGLIGAEAVLAGLLLRERTGHGVRVDSSLLGAADTLTAPAQRRAAGGADPRRPAGFRHPLRTADGWVAPADTCAGRAGAYDLRELPTDEAVRHLRAHGLTATAVTTDLADLHHDPRFAGSISRDAHGAPAVPDPWSLA
ncbi:CoA transferase [Streptomyces sp. NPDC047981]|uniref:CoA transferase n=1 Tax=Streptomyces sp. NPDC047981 TaxID=3154610 RepID=UPI00343F8FE8